MIAHVLQVESGMVIADDEPRDAAVGEMDGKVDVEEFC
jgi:hypothetical protein